MTKEEMHQLHRGGTIEPTQVAIPTLPNKCVETPKNVFNEGVPKPLTQADYNAIPLADQEAMSKLHGTDELHRVDMIAKDHAKGKKLNAIAKVQGAKKFAQNYKITLPD